MVGKTLGHYEILEPLGAGGMGEVYLGEDTRFGKQPCGVRLARRLLVARPGPALT